MAFIFPQKILFKHCDPAGIVFFPRYFEMINDCVEAFFDRLGIPFEELHQSAGVPTAEISAKFHAPSRHGDMLNIRLKIGKIGRSSMVLDFVAQCDTEIRLTSQQVLVFVGENGKSKSWPDGLRAALVTFQKEDI